jgi:O-acetyl-ADP-ribose deacetylase (regulator of RNase III)
MTIKHTTGDLLEQRVDAIVNTVNTIGVMGKGIALQFKRKWPANAKAYEASCKRKEVVPGKMLVFDNGGLVEPKFIINFPTKRHWRQPSRMSDIETGPRRPCRAGPAPWHPVDRDPAAWLRQRRTRLERRASSNPGRV